MRYAMLDSRKCAGRYCAVPAAIEFLGRPAELHNEVAGQVLGLGLAAFFNMGSPT